MRDETAIAETVFHQDQCADGLHHYRRGAFGLRFCRCGKAHPDDLPGALRLVQRGVL